MNTFPFKAFNAPVHGLQPLKCWNDSSQKYWHEGIGHYVTNDIQWMKTKQISTFLIDIQSKN